MEHKELVRIVPGSDTAVLFVHGILGTPNHFNDFVPLVPDGYSVVNIILDGHCQGVKDFAKSSMKKWRTQVSDTVDGLLATHKNLIIVAHSMGTLFSIQEGIKHPERVKKLFLMQPALRVALKPVFLSTVIKIYFNKIKDGDVETIAARNAYGVENDKRVWRYVGWLPRYFELFREIRKTRKLIPSLSVPTVSFTSRRDEMVSYKSLKIIQRSPTVTAHSLDKSRHFFYESDDKNEMLLAFRNIFNENGRH